VIGFEEFVVTLANSLMKDSVYGTVYRVGVGAALSAIDAATDIYVIVTYVGRASERKKEKKSETSEY